MTGFNVNVESSERKIIVDGRRIFWPVEQHSYLLLLFFVSSFHQFNIYICIIYDLSIKLSLFYMLLLPVYVCVCI